MDVHRRIHNSPPLVPISCHIHPAYATNNNNNNNNNKLSVINVLTQQVKS